MRKAKKINQERHAQRCDTELKLSVKLLPYYISLEAELKLNVRIKKKLD